MYCSFPLTPLLQSRAPMVRPSTLAGATHLAELPPVPRDALQAAKKHTTLPPTVRHASVRCAETLPLLILFPHGLLIHIIHGLYYRCAPLTTPPPVPSGPIYVFFFFRLDRPTKSTKKTNCQSRPQASSTRAPCTRRRPRHDAPEVPDLSAY